MFTITFKSKARKDIKKLNNNPLAKKAAVVFEQLKTNPFSIANSEKLCFAPNTYAIRLNVEHRIVYTVNKSQSDVAVISAWSHYEGARA
jgi:Txe/YoeB family toxin of toxin-antitoxin system